MSTVFTVSLKSKQPAGDGYQAAFQLTGPTSYTTNGIVLNAATLYPQSGCRLIKHVIIQSVSGNLLAFWDVTNGKIKLSYPTGGAHAPAAVTTAPKVTSGASTASAVDATDPTITGGPGLEVASTTDVSSIVLRILVQYR